MIGLRTAVAVVVVSVKVAASALAEAIFVWAWKRTPQGRAFLRWSDTSRRGAGDPRGWPL